MALFADDDVIVHRNAQGLGDLHNRLRHLDVGAGRRRVAARMVVQQATLRSTAMISQGFLDRVCMQGTELGGGKKYLLA